MELRSLECPKDEAKDEKSIGDLLLKFMNYTTAHGIGRLAESKTIAWKLFWTVVCLGTFSMFVYQVHGLFLLYLSRPVSTSVKITFEKEMSFPAVTICNLNMIRSDSIPHAVKQALRNHMQYGKSSTSQKRSRRFTAKNDSSTDDDHYGDEDYPDVDKVNTRRKARKEVFRAIIANLKFGNTYRHGHLFPKLIVQCTWKEVNCKSRKFWKRSWSNTYGNCYTFNSGSVRVNNLPVGILKSTKSGPSNGLFLHLNIEQDKYIGPMTREAGARVVLHVQGSVPFPDEEGFSVAPGMATSVGLKKTQILRLDRFGNQSCLIIDELSEQNIYRKFKNVTHYSQQVCLYSCLGLSQLSRCNCSETAYPTGGKPCKAFLRKTRRCLKKVHLLYIHDKLKCLHECRKPCKEEVIQKTISLSQWPSRAYQRYLVSRKIKPEVSDSTLLLKIFYSELNYEKIEEEFSYVGINLLADIGGQLGLWIGISVITCYEVLELLIKVFSRLLNRKYKTASQP